MIDYFPMSLWAELIPRFGVQNTFRWEEEYQLFAQTTFKEGALVEAKTNVVDMVYGKKPLS